MHLRFAALWLAVSPILIFPDIVPEAWRTTITSLAATTAIVVALVTCRSSRQQRLALCIFALALVASWSIMPRDLAGVRHFGGVAAGMLAMAVVAVSCNTPQRVISTAGWLAAAAAVVVVAGLLGTTITSAKLVLGATQMVPETMFTWLPAVRLPLPGLEDGGRVNANALGGTAAMMLPLCVSVIAAAWRGATRAPWRIVLGATSSALCVSVLLMSRSRTALVAILLTILVLLACWRAGRRWLAASLVAAIVTAGVYAYRSQQLAPDDFAEGLIHARHSLLARSAIWGEAVHRLVEQPVLGVGISQFHDAPVRDSAYRENVSHSPVAHAHNIFLQVALDIGVIGLVGYVWFFGRVLIDARLLAQGGTGAGIIAAGAALSLTAVHFFGLGDAIALGAKVGLFQWLSAGLILAVYRLDTWNGPSTQVVPALLP